MLLPAAASKGTASADADTTSQVGLHHRILGHQFTDKETGFLVGTACVPDDQQTKSLNIYHCCQLNKFSNNLLAKFCLLWPTGSPCFNHLQSSNVSLGTYLTLRQSRVFSFFIFIASQISCLFVQAYITWTGKWRVSDICRSVIFFHILVPNDSHSNSHLKFIFLPERCKNKVGVATEI